MLNKAIETIRKKFGEGSIVPLSQAKGLTVKKFSTGSFSMDMELLGGYPLGRISEQVGHPSASKTTTCLAAAAEYLALNPEHTVAYIDVENAIDPQWALGVVGNIFADRLLLLNSESGEQAGDKAKGFVFSREPVLVIIDSVAAMTPDAEIEKEFEKGLVGTHARLINRFMRVISSGMWKNMIKDTNDCATVILVNQLREKCGIVYGNPNTSPGGKGKEFHASVRASFRRAEYLTDEEAETKRKVGIKVAFTIEKNKTGPVGTTGDYNLYFRKFKNHSPGEIDNIEAIIRYAVMQGVARKVKRTITYGKIHGEEEAFAEKLCESNCALIDLANDTAQSLGVHDYDVSKCAYAQRLAKPEAGKTNSRKTPGKTATC